MEGSYNKRKKADALLIGGLLAAAFLLVFIFGKKDAGAAVRVTVDGALYGAYALDTDAVIPIKRNGVVTNTLEIRDGCADMTDADCPDKICVNQKAVSRPGETIVCLPNKVVVEVEADTGETAYDSFSR